MSSPKLGGEMQACVLLVEDDATISDLLAYNLKRAGYRVIQEYTGRAGVEAALAQNVDLVLMDVMLPGLDGMSASREITPGQAAGADHHRVGADGTREAASRLRGRAWTTT